MTSELSDKNESNKGAKCGKPKEGIFVQQKSRRIRIKTNEEIEFLEEQFLKDPKWTRKTVQHCKKFLKLRTHQIYKWGFDKKRGLKRAETATDSINGVIDTEYELSKLFPVSLEDGSSGQDALKLASDYPRCPAFDYNKIVDELVKSTKKLHQPSKIWRSDLDNRENFWQEKYEGRIQASCNNGKREDKPADTFWKEPYDALDFVNLGEDTRKNSLTKESLDSENTFRSSEWMIYDTKVNPFLGEVGDSNFSGDYNFGENSFLFKDHQTFIN